MDDDDEFGDLYTDVLRPLQAKPQQIDALPSSLGRPIGSDVEGTLYGDSGSKAPAMGLNLKLNSSALEKGLPRGGFDLNLEASSRSAGSNFQASVGFKVGDRGKLPDKGPGGSNLLEDDDLDIVLEGADAEDDNSRKVGVSGSLIDQGVALGTEQAIPGLSRKLENHGGANFENDYDSDESEDDLEIVLNDNGGGHTGMEMMKGLSGEYDEEGEPLVIVADDGDLAHHHQMMGNEQEWKGEEAGPGVDAERKTLGYASKADGGAAGPAVVAPKTGFNNHIYPHPLHSQFKYVRPGAAPIPGAAPLTSGGVQAHVRPPITAPLGAGRGRGDWRPAGIRGAVPMQKAFHPTYGSPVSGSIAGRGYGSGLDFTLPSHRTIFEVDIESFEEKPWKFPGIDVSDFFNFGLNEESWKDYCKQLEQLRLETTMQSKIRVYESSRAEQDYDPDLPPELAAAVGSNGIHTENANTGKVEAGLSELARPVGRPIPVEAGSGERVPSTDTRRLRLHDSDTIIEIHCQSMEEEEAEEEEDEEEDGTGDKEISHSGENRGTIDGIPNNGSERNEFTVYPSSSRKPEVLTRRTTRKNSMSPSKSVDDITENLPSSRVIKSEAEPTAAFEDEVYESAVDSKGQETEREERATNPSTSSVRSDERIASKKRSRSQVEQVSQEDLDSKAAISAENSKAGSGNSKDIRQFGDNVEDEVVQDRHGAHARSHRRPVDSEYNVPARSHREKEGSGGHHVIAKGREESTSRRRADPSSRQIKGENSDSRKETDISEGNWRQRDEDLHARRAGVEDTRKRAHGDISSSGRSMVRDRERGERDEKYQSRNKLEKGGRSITDYDQDIGSRQRYREDDLKNRNKEMDDFNDRRRRDGGTYPSREQGGREVAVSDYKESSSRRKRERSDGSDLWKGDDLSKSRDDGLHHVRKKEEKSQRERDERSRGRGEGNRSKESNEEDVSRKERDTKYADSRSGRPAEDKSVASRSRGKDHYSGSGRDDNQKDAGHHGDQVKRRDRSESEKVSQYRVHEDIQPRASQGSKGEKRARHDRTRASDDGGAVHTSDVAKQHEHQKKDSRRISKEPEVGENNSIANSQKNHDERRGNIGEMVHHGGKKDGEKAGKEQQTSNKRTGEASSEDENLSKRGRSKLERWASQKESDFSTASIASSSLKRSKIRDTAKHTSASSLEEKPPRKQEDKQQPSATDKEPKGEANATAKPKVDDKHLDTVEKLKKRSERFKLPMPGEKEAASTAIKKSEGDVLPSPATENHQDSDVKPERPPRKRRWTGN